MEGDETIEGDELIEVIRPFTSRALWRKRVLVQKHKIMLFRTQVIVYMGGRREAEKARDEKISQTPRTTYHQPPSNRAATPPVRSDKIWRWMRPDCTGHLLLSNTASLCRFVASWEILSFHICSFSRIFLRSGAESGYLQITLGMLMRG